MDKYFQQSSRGKEKKIITCSQCSQDLTNKKQITRFEVSKQDVLTYCETCFAKLRKEENNEQQTGA